MRQDGIFTAYSFLHSPINYDGQSSVISTFEVQRYSPDWIVQRFYGIGEKIEWIRSLVNGTTWTPWLQVWTAQNFNPVTKIDKSSILYNGYEYDHNKVASASTVYNIAYTKVEGILDGRKYWYKKYFDGTLELCMSGVLGSNENNIITFPISFVDTHYNIGSTQTSAIADGDISITYQRTDGITVHRGDSTTANTFMLMVILGRWK